MFNIYKFYNMRSRNIVQLLQSSLLKRPNYLINHIKNMHEQNVRVQADAISSSPMI
jgi:hypothetical protein